MALTPDNATIFRITHIDNVPWILKNGIHCRNWPTRDPNFREIGNPDLIAKRGHRDVPISPGGTLSDYVPFYFTPHSPMLYNIKTGFGGITRRPMSEIAIFVSSLPKIVECKVPFVFTDRHAYVAAAQFSSDLKDLDRIDWRILQARDFERDANDLGKGERYQAEALIHASVPVTALLGIVCHGTAQEAWLHSEIEQNSIALAVAARPGSYF